MTSQSEHACSDCARLSGPSPSECPRRFEGAALTDRLTDPAGAAPRYILQRLLGTGGMGAVYAAQHCLLHSAVAVKVLHQHLLDHPEPELSRHLVYRFETEARSLARPIHPGIIHVTDFGVSPQIGPFLVMELLSGLNAYQVLSAHGGRLPDYIAIEIAVQVLSALRAAHRAGLIHRDVKPLNLFLAEDPYTDRSARVRVLDFGLVKLNDLRSGRPSDPADPDQTQLFFAPGAIMGTLEYMSPEQLRAPDQVDARSDLYSVGATLLELLTGRCQVSSRTPGDIERVESGNVLRSPRSVCTDVPVRLDAIVQRAMAHNPDERYASAEEMLVDLEAHLAELPDEALALREEWIHHALAVARAKLGIQGPVQPLPTIRPRPLRRLRLAVAGVVGVLAGVALAVIPPRLTRPPELGPMRADAERFIDARLAWPGDVPPRRIDALTELALTRDPSQARRIGPSLREKDAAERVQAAEALGRIRYVEKGDYKVLLELAQESQDDRVRLAAKTALLRIGEQDQEEKIAQELASQDPGLRLDAALILSEMAEDPARRTAAVEILQREQAAGPNKDTPRVLRALLLAEDEETRHALLSQLRREFNRERKALIASLLADVDQPEAIKTLHRLLQEGGKGELLAASKLLGRGESRQAEPLLGRLLSRRENPESARLMAARGLGDGVEMASLAQLAVVLRDGRAPLRVRLAAAGALLRRTASEASQGEISVPLIEAALDHPSPGLRARAASTLSLQRGEAAQPQLLRRMEADPAPVVRISILKDLPAKERPEALRALARMLGDRHPEVRVLTALALSAQRGAQQVRAEIEAPLRRLAEHGGPRERAAAGVALARLEPAWRGELHAALRDPDPAARLLVLREAALSPEELIAQLPAADFAVRFLAARRLWEQGRAEGERVLREALSRPGIDAVLAWAHLRSKEPALPAPEGLRRRLREGDTPARMDALRLAPALPAAQRIDLLQQMARDPSAAVRRQVPTQIAQAAQSDPALREQMAPLLRRLRQDGDPGVRQSAVAPPPRPLPPRSVPDMAVQKPTTRTGTKMTETKTPPSPCLSTPRSDLRQIIARCQEASKDLRGQRDRVAVLLRLAGAYEALGEWLQAARIYDDIAQERELSRQTRRLLQAAEGRLAQHLGRLHFLRVRDGRCEPRQVWVLPGRSMHDLGRGKMEEVQVRAGQTFLIGSCQ